jgi:hypothetical protein
MAEREHVYASPVLLLERVSFKVKYWFVRNDLIDNETAEEMAVGQVEERIGNQSAHQMLMQRIAALPPPERLLMSALLLGEELFPTAALPALWLKALRKELDESPEVLEPENG